MGSDPLQGLSFHVVVFTLESGAYGGRVLFYPEVAACAPSAEAMLEKLQKAVRGVRERLPALELHRRHAVPVELLGEITVEVAPPPHSTAWQNPVQMAFQAAAWRYGESACVAYVPALDIEVIAATFDELVGRLPEEILATLLRRKINTSLCELAMLQNCRSVVLQTHSWLMERKTPKQMAIQRNSEKGASVLATVATDLTQADSPKIFGLDDVVLRMADLLCGAAPQSVLLIGPSGAGKTSAVVKLAALRAGSPIWSTSGSRLVAGASGYGMWQKRCQTLCHEASASHSVVHLGNLGELMQVGQSICEDQGIGDFLRPAIARGDILAIAECTPEQLTSIERRNAAMLEAFARVDVPEPSLEDGRRVLDEAVRYWASADQVAPGTVEKLDRLHRRYATYSAYPGRPLRFLRNQLDEHPSLTPQEVTAAFSRETGLPLVLLEPEERLDLEETCRWFSSRVMGQTLAVQTVVDLLATVKAQLSRPGRPLASLLFIGPTGVGKTEMAKTLAEFLYQDPRRMTRIDMSEYADPLAVERLMGGAEGEGVLTSRVREQPFGVVLLDEFEKAHPALFDMLLQVLGEGRLTDSAGRLADFRNSVIIMTSNLGVESFGRQAVGFLEPDLAGEADAHFSQEVEKFLRPEMFNRIDRIVTFRPLARKTLLDVARRELERLERRDGLRQRRLTLRFDDEALEEIVRLGYDPRYGARPIKRAIERHVLVPLAKVVNERCIAAPSQAEVAVRDGNLYVALSSSPDTAAGASDAEKIGREPAQRCVELWAQATELGGSPPVKRLRNELFWLQRQMMRSRRKARPVLTPQRLAAEAQLKILTALATRLDDLTAKAAETHEAVLTAYLAGRSAAAKAVHDLDACWSGFDVLKRDLFARDFDHPDYITLMIYGEDRPWLMQLAAAYHRQLLVAGLRVQAYQLLVYNYSEEPGRGCIPLGDRNSTDKKKRRQANGTRLQADRFSDFEVYTAQPSQALRGIGLCTEGHLAWPTWSAEAGLHVFVPAVGSRVSCLVHASAASIADYQPPQRIDRSGGIGSQEVRRTYDRRKNLIDDRQPKGHFRWSGNFGDVIREMVARSLTLRMTEWLGS